MPDWMWIQNVVFPILGMAMGTFAMYGVYRTVNKVLDRRHERQLAEAGGGGRSPELDDLRSRVDLLEDAVDRVSDLEERLDFAERLLAQQQRRQVEP